jgi:hypothetical protein
MDKNQGIKATGGNTCRGSRTSINNKPYIVNK